MTVKILSKGTRKPSFQRATSTKDANEKGADEKIETVTTDVPVEDELTEQEKRRLTLKLDLRLMPIAFLMYAINILSVTAVPFGFRQDVGLTGTTYNTGISLFFVFYIIAEIPSNLILKRVGAKVWLPSLALCYGSLSFGTAYISTPGQFYAIRILLGLAEAGTNPGIAYVLSTYYDRPALTLRVPIFGCASPFIAGVTPFLANAYVRLGNIAPNISSWRNILFINGLLTLGIALLGFWLFPTNYLQATFLTERERNHIARRNMKLYVGKAEEENTTWKLVLRCAKNPVCLYGFMPSFVGQVFANSLKFFMAIIVQQLFNSEGAETNVKVGTVFFVATGALIIIGFLTDKTNIRAPWFMFCLILTMIGSAMLVYAKDANVRYGGCFLAASGGYALHHLIVAWTSINLAPYTTRSAGVAFVVSVGGAGGIFGSYIFIPSEAERNYPTGGILLMVLTSFVLIMTCLYTWWLVNENRARKLGKRDWRLEQTPKEEWDTLGSLHPDFRYAI